MARDFSSDILDGGDITALDSQSELSFHVWVKPDTLSSDMVIFGKAPSGFTGGITLFFDKSGPNASNTLDLFLSPTRRIASSTSNVFTAGEWHSVCGRISASSNDLYIDNVLIGSNNLQNSIVNSDSLLVGAHSNPSDRRYWDGGIAYLTFWDTTLSASDIAALAAGQSPTAIKPASLLRHWDIAGDSSPEPESIEGSDVLTVSGTTQITGPLSAATLTLPVESDITETTAIVGCSSSRFFGDLYCYVSTSATPPSATDLKSGTGAVFSASKLAIETVDPSLATLPPAGFVVDGVVLTDADNGDTGVGAPQGVATDGTWNFVSYSERIYVYDSSWVYQSHIDTSALNGGAHSQVNGMFPHDGTLYVTANEFPTLVDSWVFQFSINAGTGALTYVSATSLSAGGSAEAPCRDSDGNWWVCSHDKHGVDKYNSSWVFQAYYPFPAGNDPGTSRWQGLIWYGDYLLVNVHNENANSPRADVYEFDGTSFSAYDIGLVPPTAVTGQGIYADGDYILWVERISTTLGNVIRTFAESGATTNVKFLVEGLSAGTTYYTYFLHETDPEDSDILESGSWSTAGAGGGLPSGVQAIRILAGGSWELAVPYVLVGGSWEIATPKILSGGSWVDTTDVTP
jgi:hypothetical protein